MESNHAEEDPFEGICINETTEPTDAEIEEWAALDTVASPSVDENSDDGRDAPDFPAPPDKDRLMGTTIPETSDGDPEPRGPEAGDGDAEPSSPKAGDGDAEPRGPEAGDGDAEPSSPEAGDGDAEPSSPGAGDGDAEPSSPEAGDGDAEQEELLVRRSSPGNRSDSSGAPSPTTSGGGALASDGGGVASGGGALASSGAGAASGGGALASSGAGAASGGGALASSGVGVASSGGALASSNEQQPQQGQYQALYPLAAPPPAGGWGGWGGWLREAAADAVRDVKDLTDTLQAVLADATGADSEAAVADGDAADEDEDSGAVRDGVQQQQEPAAGHSVWGSTGGDPPGAAAAKVETAPTDPALEAGLQAIDAQVEQLASGAAKALTGLWGGLSSVAKVAAGVLDVRSSEAVRGVAKMGSKLAHTAERGLETVGRLLEEVAGVGASQQHGDRRIWGQGVDSRAAEMDGDPASFQDFFYIYGGEQLAEEVGKLSNECAQLCNKSRAKLAAEQQAALDSVLATLGPYFSNPEALPTHITCGAVPPGDAAAPAAPASDSNVAPEGDGDCDAAERLAQMYGPIGYLCADSHSRAESFLRQLLAAGAEAAAAEEAHRAGNKMTEEDRTLASEGSREGSAGEDAAAGRDPDILLNALRAHATKRLAEVATAQLQLLLNLGASLAALARNGRRAEDGIRWPDSSEQQAALLAGEARRMLQDLQAMTDAYIQTLQAVIAMQPAQSAAATVPLAEGVDRPGLEQQPATTAPLLPAGSDETDRPPVTATAAAELCATLTSYSAYASTSVWTSYKGLLYAVLLRSLVASTAQGEVGDGGQAALLNEEAVEMIPQDNSGGDARVENAILSQEEQEDEEDEEQEDEKDEAHKASLAVSVEAR